MVDESGTLIVYASGVGTVLGQSGTKQSTLTTVYVDVIGGEFDENSPDNLSDFITGLPQNLGAFVHMPYSSGYHVDRGY
jgi:hypothetical protein